MMAPNNRFIQIHASAIDIGGFGVLVLGESRSGKSTLVLELVSRGHRFVADDAVVLSKKGGRLVCGSHDLVRGVLCIRKDGIVDIAAHFGPQALSRYAILRLCFELGGPVDASPLTAGNSSTTRFADYLGVRLPLIRVGRESAPDIAIHIERTVREFYDSYLAGKSYEMNCQMEAENQTLEIRTNNEVS